MRTTKGKNCPIARRIRMDRAAKRAAKWLNAHYKYRMVRVGDYTPAAVTISCGDTVVLGRSKLPRKVSRADFRSQKQNH